MVLDQECPHQAEKKLFLEDVKKEEKRSLLNQLISLKKRSEFLYLRKSGLSKNGTYFIVNYYFTNVEQIKFGLTVSKKMGNAVKRNYIKRVIRALINKNISSIPRKINFEIIPKKKIETRVFKDLENDFKEIFMQLEV